MRGRLTTKNSVLFTAMALVCMFTVGCSHQGSATEKIETVAAAKTETLAVSNTENEIKIVEAILQEELNGPDEKYIQLSEAAMGGRGTDSVKQKENEMKLKSYMKEKFLPYYTEEGLERARSTNMIYQYQSQFEPDSEGAIRLIDSEVKQSEIDTASNQYYIKATVEYTSPGEKSSLHEIEGRIIFSTKEGKIGDIQLVQKDSSLSKKIRNWQRK